MNLQHQELVLCIAALEYAAKELREGLDASVRLGMPMPDGVEVMAAQMTALRDKLYASGGDGEKASGEKP